MTDPLLSIRNPLLLGCSALLALVLGLGLWATQARLAGAIIVQGRVEVEDDRQILQHPDGGVVIEILVRDGDLVAPGDILLRLDDSALRSQTTILDGRLAELAAVIARLEAEHDGLPTPIYPDSLLVKAGVNPTIATMVDGQDRLFDARRATLTEAQERLSRRIEQARAQAEGVTAQRRAVDTLLALNEREAAAQQALLDKGLVTQSALLAIDRERARLQGQQGELAASLARIADQITEIELQISALTTQRREQAAAELRQLAPQMLELTETRRALADRIDRLDLRAPVAGVVFGLRITTPGAVLRPADPALYLIPQDRPLRIAARLAPSRIDAVALGQTAELAFPAFPTAEVPRLKGRVILISADALPDPQTAAPFYLLRLELAPGEEARLGNHALLPGMPVDVFLLTTSRSPLAYLAEPFTRYLTRALREG